MTDLTEELKEALQGQLRQQEELLRVARDRFEDSRDIINRWPARKKKFGRGFFTRFDRWKAQLKHVIRPLNLKRYKREKKRLKRAGNVLFGSRQGQRLLMLKFLNILRFLMLIIIYFGMPAFLIYLALKKMNVL
jgi:hypothetical protein